MKLRPLYNRIVVEWLETESKVGSIIVPEKAKEKPTMAKVLAVGPGAYVGGHMRELSVRVGDTVLMGKYSGTDVKYGGKTVTIATEDDVMAVVE